MLQKKRTFADLENSAEFMARHIGPNAEDQQAMLATLGCSNLGELTTEVVPEAIAMKEALDIVDGCTEVQALAELRQMAKLNQVFKSYIGQGYYGTITPNVIQRNILENPAWYTAYTPYQPEISQGRLEALINFQTMITDLTGMEMANASMLDEGTAAAEAMALCQRVSKSKSTRFLVDTDCLPQTIEIIKTRAEPMGIEVVVIEPGRFEGEAFGALLQYPGASGEVRDYRQIIQSVQSNKGLVVMAADILSLVLLESPGTLGADVAIGSTQRFGVPLGYGGPHAGYMATREAYKRNLPGRLVGLSQDANGEPAYRLALQTREQHIRREKATSNVCTAQALLAVMASFYAVFHGPEGLKAIAQRIHRKTVRLAKGLETAGFKVEPDAFFDTITVEVGLMQKTVMDAAVREGINLRAVGKTKIGITLDERTRRKVTEAVWRAFGITRNDDDLSHDYRVPDSLHRRSKYLEHDVFHMNRAETEMMRYMRRLADRDLALDRAMIPLGSCTMKLNSAAEMMPVSWREFSLLHPFAPKDQALGYEEMISDLSSKLCDITGYDAISMQPNSGAQGEYAGLLTIAEFHRANGEEHRNVCLIPTSAHGTNPASAQMVGWKVIPVQSAENGDIDVQDFREKAEIHKDDLAGCMITYPSTHGVFEETVHEVCAIIHEYGGQVYIDGANMNAMVGLSRPGDIGGDVSHLNLHKTFCIPHGGGGPGMGPIGVKAHLTPHLPGHPELGGDTGPVSAAPFGSPSLLPISWAYCLMMGGEGLTQATRVAILNANYIAKRLEGSFDVLYRGANGRVAHECIIDTRPFAETAGVSVDDIAKRLIDSGFHAPTMSWPVAGTLMIEPTESETKAELDRFCDAMLSIREEIRLIEDGKYPKDNNPLCNAPHTVQDLVGTWERPYSREQGCFPPGAFKVDKYWPPVNRIDNVYGDRHLICTCPPMSEYAEAAE